MKKYLLIAIGAASVGTAAYAQPRPQCPPPGADIPFACVRNPNSFPTITCNGWNEELYINQFNTIFRAGGCRNAAGTINQGTGQTMQATDPATAPSLFSYAGLMHALGLAPAAAPTMTQSADAMHAYNAPQPTMPAYAPAYSTMPPEWPCLHPPGGNAGNAAPTFGNQAIFCTGPLITITLSNGQPYSYHDCSTQTTPPPLSG